MILVANQTLRSTLSSADLEQIQLLLHRETEMLDKGQFDEWLKLFAEQCTYWLPATPEQTDPLTHVSLFYENRDLMETRVARLQDGSAHALADPLRTSHVTGPLTVEGTDNDSGDIIVGSRFLMTEYQRDEQRQFAGSYTYHLRRINDVFRISLKRVDLINCDSVFEPLQVYI